jgi:hypothetical protein
MATRTARRSRANRGRPSKQRGVKAVKQRARSPARSAKARRKPARTRAARRPARSRPSRRTAGQATSTQQGTPAALDFQRDERSSRIGDALPIQQQREEFPRQRVREAGKTAGETTRPQRNTADDAAPDTLLDDEGGQTPADQRGPMPADTALSVVDQSAIGAGGGSDEAEDARRHPISRAELARIKRRVARSGGAVANVEPYESRAGNPGRERNGGGST